MTAWMQTGRGRPIDLLAPDLTAIDVAAEIAWPLAGLARFAAHQETNEPEARQPIWSVAQHCVVGADAVFAETGSLASALAFLVHDAHEAFIGDLTTPVANALEDHVETVVKFVFGLDAATRIRDAFGQGAAAAAITGLRTRLDRRIHALAGLPVDLPAAMMAIVRDMDLRMLDAERRQILGPVRMAPGEGIWPAAVRQAKPVRLRGPLRPWPRHKAATEWMTRWERWRIRPADTRPQIPPRSRPAAIFTPA